MHGFKMPGPNGPSHPGPAYGDDSSPLDAYAFVDALPNWNDASPSRRRGWRASREVLAAAWLARRSGVRLQVLEAGPGTGPGLERVVAHLAPELTESIVVDRIDIVDSTLAHPMIRNCWHCSVEDMPMVPSGTYDLVVAQWLLEHVEDVGSAAREFARVLRPGGRMCAKIPNPAAPEFVLSRFTSYRFHRFFVGGTSPPTPTRYAFHDVDELMAILKRAGLDTLLDDRVPCVGRYLGDRATILGRLGLGGLGMRYDRLLVHFGLRNLMGDVFLVAQRTGTAACSQPNFL